MMKVNCNHIEGRRFVLLLKECSENKDLHTGARLHSEILQRRGLFQKNPYVSSALINMYAKCGDLMEAQRVHDELCFPDIPSWNALISSYAQQNQGHQVINCLKKLQSESLSFDEITSICALKACGSVRDIELGKHIHVEILCSGLCEERNVMIGTCLVDMYAKCGKVSIARRIHDGIQNQDVISWSALIEGYAQQGRGHDALDCFDRMLVEDHYPNAITFISTLKACSIIRAIDKGKWIHDGVTKRGLLDQNSLLGTSLVDMYVKCGFLAEAQKLHDQLRVRDVVTWSALITGYTQQGQGHNALKCFELMQNDGLSPNAVTFTCILKACGNIGAIDKGKHLHDVIVSMGLLEKDIVLCTALVDMYAKCGALARAQQVHDKLSTRNEASWNALITGYAQQGQGHEALGCFQSMQGDGISPNRVTFLCVLNACSRSGLLDEAKNYFENVNRKYSITPTLEHHTCMMMVFACAGHFDKALSMIELMPSCDYFPLWLALLGACRKWGNVKVGRLAFDHVIQLDRSCAAAYTLLTNIYVGSGMVEEARRIDTTRLKLRFT